MSRAPSRAAGRAAAPSADAPAPDAPATDAPATDAAAIADAEAALGPAADWPLCRLPADWAAALRPLLDPARMASLRGFLVAELRAGARVFPEPSRLFEAFALTPLERVRAVILGQDPYHGAGQAHGLAFSVRPGVRVPPSLRNIFRELRDDLGIAAPADGDLSAWARGGVLLLNTALSVREAEANSHAGRGWEDLTDAAVRAVSARDAPAVFVLWGAHAGRKAALVDRARHGVVAGVHPSGLSAHRGFFGSRPFSAANAWLRAHGAPEVDWRPAPD